ncbi:hypothetical protein AK830_g848 [Neonectria ditissima]|uniref:Peroxisomal membrane protein PEX14 n=1 Tax=Neonectria ditissima TaxID=78410 RepID=A0A0P7C163_9HYPO|nr:hypothetical protein AK830_g848 [Neonectria ditissima]
MADSNPKPDTPAVPSWQRAEPEDAASEASSAAIATDAAETEPETEAEPETKAEPVVEAQAETAPAAPAAPEENMLDVARKFLDDDAIRDAPLEKKVAFLEAKGISDANIQTLLADAPAPVTSKDDAPEEAAAAQPPAQSTSTQTTPSQPPSDRAPIVTYPEFLAKPARPPPLVTTNRLLNTLYAVIGLSTLVYGTGKYVLGPMVDAQTEARAEFHDATVRRLDSLVTKLEKTVSVVPPAKKNTPGDDESEAEDPAEMFHRDMGTQTSFPLTTTTATKGKDAGGESTTKRQADRLAALTKTLSGLKDEFRSESEGMEGIKTLVDVLRDDLDSLTYSGQIANTFDLYGRTRKPEPEDEIRKVRDNIRRVKGVLLSTRNFPTTAR